MWILFALIGYIALAVVFVLDKFILTETVSKPVVYTFYSTIFMFGALLAWPLGVEMLVGIDWLWALVSGLGFGFGMWAMFIAVKGGEASHVNPFIGAVITIVTFGLASVFLGESLTSVQLLGMLVLAGSTLLLAFFNERGFTGFNKSYAWGIVAAVLFAVSHTTAKYLYEVYPFLTGFVWTRATTGIVGLLVLFAPAVRQTFVPVSRSHAQADKRRASIVLVVGDKVLSVVGVVLIQLAIALGSVTLVNALVGVQYALMFAIDFLAYQVCTTSL
jgi:drug/metabolite transporter (DMT)-like permease